MGKRKIRRRQKGRGMGKKILKKTLLPLAYAYQNKRKRALYTHKGAKILVGKHPKKGYSLFLKSPSISPLPGILPKVSVSKKIL